jgi:predicted AlkP superfamily pyrophosphatase or phosphodiesterase
MCCTVVIALGLPASASGATRVPRLTVVIVVDQLRADLPDRVAAELAADDGFLAISNHGVVFDQTFYEHATTSTAPGHATLFTGAHPSEHGIIANLWYDRASGRRLSAVASPQVRGVPGPYNLLATTIGDELTLDCGSRCKVFAVSGKDRGAIFAAGRLGKAFWFDTRNGGFRSSAYYFGDLPRWVEQWNSNHESAYPEQWSLLRDRQSYRISEQDDRPFERPPSPMGRTFPHPLGHRADTGFFGVFRHTPYFDALTLEFVRSLIETEDIGGDAYPDLLAVSLSATDYIGHAFGPNSLEAEDNLLRLDRTLAEFIRFLDARIGRDQYLLVLTADHGVVGSPEYAASQGEKAIRVDAAALLETINQGLMAALDIGWPAITAFVPPTLYFDRTRLEAAGIALARAVDAAAAIAEQQEGIADALPVARLASDDPLAEYVRNSIDARSGELYLVEAPHSAIVDGLDLYTAYHGSPYAADRHIPLEFYGGRLAPQHVERPVSPRSLAATLAAVLGVPRPSHANAAALPEVIDGFETP